MSIEAYQHHDTTESIAPSELSVAQHLSEEDRADLQAVIDTRPSKPLLLPQSMQEVMSTLDTGEEGEPTTAGRVIAIRKYAQEKLARSKGTQAETITETEVEVPTHTNASAKHRRSYSDAGASPYATGDGMIHVSKGHVDIQGGGTVTSGARGDGKSRRATREASSLPVAELVPEEREYEQRIYSDGSHHIWVTDKNGKKRQMKWASVLAEHGHAGDFQGKRPVHTAADTDTMPANDDSLVMPTTYRDKAAWDKKTDAEKHRIIAIDDMIAADEAEHKNEQTPQTRRAAIRNLGHLAAAKAMTGITKIGEYYRDAEKGKRRKLTTAVIAGATALAGAGIYYFATKNGVTAPTGNHLAELSQNKPHDIAGKHAALVELQPKKVAVPSALIEKLPEYNARTGAGTIDHLVADQAHKLGYHLNNAQHHALTQSTLNTNHLSWEDARHLPVGYQVKELSPEQIAELLKKRS